MLNSGYGVIAGCSGVVSLLGMAEIQWEHEKRRLPSRHRTILILSRKTSTSCAVSRERRYHRTQQVRTSWKKMYQGEGGWPFCIPSWITDSPRRLIGPPFRGPQNAFFTRRFSHLEIWYGYMYQTRECGYEGDAVRGRVRVG